MKLKTDYMLKKLCYCILLAPLPSKVYKSIFEVVHYMAYSKILRRQRSEKTNYKKRGIMLMGKRDFITVVITNENAQVQILTPNITGDKVVASAHSRYLTSKGWKGSRKSIPASYLIGYLAGKKAISKGAKSALLYSGTRRYTQRMAYVFSLCPLSKLYTCPHPHVRDPRFLRVFLFLVAIVISFS